MKTKLSIFIFLAALLCAPLFGEIAIDVAIPDDTKKPDGDGGNNVTANAELKPDIVNFKNKDKIHGRMVSVIPDKGMLWKSEEALGDITFKTTNIHEIIRGNVAYVQNSGDTAVLLTNEDMLAGKLVKLDDKEIVLKTTYAGEVKINRNMIQSIFPGSDSGSINFRGPNKMEEWTLPNNRNSNSNVAVKDGELVISGHTAVGRDMKLGDMSKVEFDMDAMGNCQFQIQIYSGKVDRYPRDGYVVYMSSGYIYMQRYGNGRADNLGNFQARTFSRGKGKITILANKKKKSISLLINDTVSKTWTDSSWAGAGKYLVFINQSNSTVKVKNILVGKWSGKVPGKDPSESDKEKDTIKFNNDDVVSGKLQAIEDEKVTFKTEYAEMNIPITRVKEIVTAMDSRHRARRRANDVKFLFENGEAVTMELTKITGDSIEGESGNFGKTTMKLNAFKKIQFNIYDD